MSIGRTPNSNPRQTVDTGEAAFGADAVDRAGNVRNVPSPKTVGSVERSVNAGWINSLALVEAVAKARTESETVTTLVAEISRRLPGASVRCGIGGTSIRRLYDNRLGWLGPSSDLFQYASSCWNDDPAALPMRDKNQSQVSEDRVAAQPGLLRLNIDDEVGLGRCVLFLQTAEVDDVDRRWLRSTLPALRAIIWQRTGGMFSQLVRFLANSGMTTRIYIGLCVLLVLLLSIWPVSYRVRCSVVVRPQHSRVVSAPFDATLLSSQVQPGDPIRQGDTLFVLDGRPIRLELESLDAEIGQAEKERDIAMVGGRVADAQQARLKATELQRRKELLLDRLEQLQVVSPIDGVVVSGDLDQSIGATLKMGQTVLELAPLDQMVVELEIPDHEIGFIQPNTVARIRLNAGGGDAIEKPLDRLYPAAEVRDDQNVFVACVNLPNADRKLRPGMRGDAIAYGPVRPWLWSMVRTGWERTLWWIGY
ncbi:efflux RND transporter periplasmic adaptor subunit [Roseiconus nitratireducens]|uniref:Efflux RND transporter periplasmic adaptor subunit n=1 Tax=Roseiconus nitratireducens TaxID=2605748 RepID=A0A5M6DI47_9BACT|nr:HlyD family efflux transporter periplasmic adaptor subunit [Roseiconus nitratireducens]KAA5545910.1 efflux RND transporter periplasmic adaptor subunit [Roseiconus nitratireducens]